MKRVKVKLHNVIVMGRCMSFHDAHQLLAELDEKLRPWGEPGVVPTAPGTYEIRTKEKRLWATLNEQEMWQWPRATDMVIEHIYPHVMQETATMYRWRFRAVPDFLSPAETV
jgi:hypothetical protein